MAIIWDAEAGAVRLPDGRTVMPEWSEWNAESGFIHLPDGRRVKMRGGDMALIAVWDDGCVVVDHAPATRH